MTIDLSMNALVAVLAVCFTLCWVAVAGRKNSQHEQHDNHPGKPGKT
ncbi:MAG: hypothetical protein JST45_06905 [Bacteroidetes bacterium]|nr:hypothetical protein [Bacteroidota bacterium]